MKSLVDLSDAELLRERNRLNASLEDEFYASSGRYDTRATMLRLVEAEINRREHEGPPWIVD